MIQSNAELKEATTVKIMWETIYWTWVISEVAILIVTRTRPSGGNVRDRGSLLLLWPIIIASITVATWFGQTHRHTLSGAHWVLVASIVLLAAGLILRWMAILKLGKSFSANVAIHATQTIKKTGIFRFVRHPSYSGLLIVFAAIGLHTRNWIGLAILLIPTTVALLYRIHVEEAALREAFRDEYERYSRTTKRLIPGLY